MIAPTGVLRASINLGNPVLARGTAESPTGVTVDLAREIGRRLDVPVELLCFTAARDSFAALTDGRADLGFLAIEPARAAQVAFTDPYTVIEGVYCVPATSAIASPDDVDRPGVRIGVKEGSAYDLFLSRTLDHATLVRGAEGVDVFAADGLEVGAGIRQPVTAYVEAHQHLRLVEPPFMEIRQACAVPLDRPAADVAWLTDLVAELVASGFVAESLGRTS